MIEIPVKVIKSNVEYINEYTDNIIVRYMKYPNNRSKTLLFYIEYDQNRNKHRVDVPSLHILPVNIEKRYYINFDIPEELSYDKYKRCILSIIEIDFIKDNNFNITLIKENGERRHIGKFFRDIGKFFHQSAVEFTKIHSLENNTLRNVSKFFVGGFPKSGTTWVEKILNSNKRILCTGQGNLMRAICADELVRISKKDINIKYNTWFGQDRDPVDEARFKASSIIDRIFTCFSLVAGNDIIGDRAPENAKHYKMINLLFPDAKIIHCIRNPLDIFISRVFHELNLWRNNEFMLSEINKEEYKSLQFLVEKETEDYVDNYKELISSSPMFKRLTNQWMESELWIHTMSTDLFSFMKLRYEDLKKNTMESIFHIYKHLGIELNDYEVKRIEHENRLSRMSRDAGTQTSFFRKGIVGDFKNYLTKEFCFEWVENNKKSLIKLGYYNFYKNLLSTY